jgi:protein-tyrosine phosphatase
MSTPGKRSILFVCLGNICRSPLAEAVARREFERAGLDVRVASAGLGDWHVGGGADPRARACAVAHGYDLTAHRARAITSQDFAAFDWLLAMDRANLHELRRRCPAGHHSKLALFLPFAGAAPPEEVPDPYSGDLDDFRRVLELARRGVAGLIARWRDAA